MISRCSKTAQYSYTGTYTPNPTPFP